MAKWAERCDNCDRGFCHGCAGEYTGWVIGAQSLNKSNQNSYFFGTKNGPYPLGSIITDAKKWMAL
jgi:hypothetical protein